MYFMPRFCLCFFGESEIWFTNWDSFRTELGSVVNHVLKFFLETHTIGERTCVWWIGLFLWLGPAALTRFVLVLWLGPAALTRVAVYRCVFEILMI